MILKWGLLCNQQSFFTLSHKELEILMKKQFVLIKHAGFSWEAVDSMPLYEMFKFFAIYEEFVAETKKAMSEQ